MYKSIIFVALVVLVLVSPQRADARSNVRAGIGTDVGLSLSLGGGLTPTATPSVGTLRFPLFFGAHVRIEPELGYLRVGDDSGHYDSLRLGSSAAVSFWDENVDYYFGMRAGAFILLISDEDNSTSFFVGGVGGGEYFLSRQFSLGAEVQLNYTNFANTETYAVVLATNFVARLYFN